MTKMVQWYDNSCFISNWSTSFLPLFHWQYARADEVDKLRQDYQDGINTLKMFMDATNEKMTAPVQVSFLNVRAFVQDVEVNRPYILSCLFIRNTSLKLMPSNRTYNKSYFH